MTFSVILIDIYLISLTFGMLKSIYEMSVILKNYKKIEFETPLLNYKIRNGVIILAFILVLISWAIPVINTISVVTTFYELFKTPNKYTEDYLIDGIITALRNIKF